MTLNLKCRPRRLRKSPSTLDLMQETQLMCTDLILPVFIHSGHEVEEIETMPGVFRWPLNRLAEQLSTWHSTGLRGFALFPKILPKFKDDRGSEILNSESITYQAARILKGTGLDFVLIADLALDPYTTHGQDGIINESGGVENDETVEILAQASILCASAGFNWVAPSDMMDGRVGSIRKALDKENFHDVSIMAYSAKFCSAYYGPFRGAIGSSIGGDYINKSTYQLNPCNAHEAHKELILDDSEGADILMVKPAETYLDIIYWAKQNFKTPIAAYQVSGEYSRICAAGQLGWLDPEACAMESLISIKRAGADLILSYFADRIVKLLQ